MASVQIGDERALPTAQFLFNLNSKMPSSPSAKFYFMLVFMQLWNTTQIYCTAYFLFGLDSLHLSKNVFYTALFHFLFILAILYSNYQGWEFALSLYALSLKIAQKVLLSNCERFTLVAL